MQCQNICPNGKKCQRLVNPSMDRCWQHLRGRKSNRNCSLDQSRKRRRLRGGQNHSVKKQSNRKKLSPKSRNRSSSRSRRRSRGGGNGGKWPSPAVDGWVVYGYSNCPYTIKVLQKLQSRGLDVKKIMIDRPDKPVLLEQLKDNMGGQTHNTMPLVFKDGRFLGGSESV